MVKEVKLKFPQVVNKCSCGVNFVVFYVDGDNELFPQVVDICPYCGAYINDDSNPGKVLGEE